LHTKTNYTSVNKKEEAIISGSTLPFFKPFKPFKLSNSSNPKHGTLNTEHVTQNDITSSPLLLCYSLDIP